jgi:hypothetical protein
VPLMTMLRAPFRKVSFEFWLALLPVRQERTKPVAWAVVLAGLAVCSFADPEISKREGVSRKPWTTQPRARPARQHQFVSFGSTATAASLHF